MRRLLSNLVPRVFSRFSNLLAANQEKRVFSSLLPPYWDTRRPWERGQAVSAALSMVRTGLEKSLKKHHVLEESLKIEKLWDILEKSLNFPQKSLNIFESSLNKITFVKKSVLRKGKNESTAVRKFSWLS